MTKTPQQLAKERQHIFDAFAEGQEVQRRVSGQGGQWWDTESLAQLLDPNVEWRVKPKKLECWVNVYPNSALTWYRTEAEAKEIGVTEGTARIAVHMVEADD